MIRKNINKKAFTLIELLVSMSVIALITILFIANYNSANKRTDLIMTAQTMTSDIHFAQSNALGLVRYGIYGVPAGGWGVYFDKDNNTYTVFADLNEEGTMGYKEYDPNLEGNVFDGSIINKISQDLEIDSLVFSNGTATTSADTAIVSFLPPDPKTNIYNPNNSNDYIELEIHLKEKDSEKKQIVKVNFLGLVEVID